MLSIEARSNCDSGRVDAGFSDNADNPGFFLKPGCSDRINAVLCAGLRQY